MKTTIMAIALALTTTSASAYTCKNTVESINGDWVYTSSQCGNQAPASAEVLEMITYIANNPPKDSVVVTYTKVDSEEMYRLRKVNPEIDGLVVRKKYYTITTTTGSDGSVTTSRKLSYERVTVFRTNGTETTWINKDGIKQLNKTTGTHTWVKVKNGEASTLVSNGWVKQ